MKKVLLSVITTLCLFGVFGLTGCNKKNTSSNVIDKEILVVSFGTSFNDSRHITIGGIENAIRENFPEYKVARAFTSDIIISVLKERDNIIIDNVTEAFERAVADGIKTLIVQPTHLMSGFEYADLKKEFDKYKNKFDKIELGTPLLTSDDDYEKVVKSITSRTARYDDGKTAICFMGHGTEAESNDDYAKLQSVLAKNGFNNYYIGTVEAAPTVEDVIESLNIKGSYTNVVLIPLMVVAGDHANNDMASDEEDSWKSLFENAGYNVSCVIEGLGQYYDIQTIYVSHTQEAINSLK